MNAMLKIYVFLCCVKTISNISKCCCRNCYKKIGLISFLEVGAVDLRPTGSASDDGSRLQQIPHQQMVTGYASVPRKVLALSARMKEIKETDTETEIHRGTQGDRQTYREIERQTELNRESKEIER